MKKNKELKFLIEFGVLVKRLYDKNPRQTLKNVLLDTYKLIETTEVFEGEEMRWENIEI